MANRLQRFLVFLIVFILGFELPCKECFSFEQKELHLILPEKKRLETSAQCRTLIENFLVEMRSILPDTTATINSEFQNKNDSLETYQLKCSDAAQENIIILSEMTGSKKEFRFRYSPPAKGFDSSDWLQFQRREYRKISLGPSADPRPALERDAPNQTIAAVPVYKKWWFWTALSGAAAVGLSAFLLSRRDSSKPPQIEVH